MNKRIVIPGPKYSQVFLYNQIQLIEEKQSAKVWHESIILYSCHSKYCNIYTLQLWMNLERRIFSIYKYLDKTNLINISKYANAYAFIS